MKMFTQYRYELHTSKPFLRRLTDWGEGIQYL